MGLHPVLSGGAVIAAAGLARDDGVPPVADERPAAGQPPTSFAGAGRARADAD
jgi:hypothetical protein